MTQHVEMDTNGKTADELHDRIRFLRDERLKLLRKDGRIPYSGPNRDTYDQMTSEIENLMVLWRYVTIA
ncbi:hypothetical protein [Burkholderia metallica]|uniref:hypothetical protein n=1 Tax=Burkholderia metallica TaxID=488729 RepID=UPI001CF39E39|nr:hypothetical protein [Burkholderia metallica]MCA8018105.1 hypothetical protein [Burkholderia metallica]